MLPGIRVENSAPKRMKRSPNFPIAGTVRPYGLYPLWVHPVLPGETLQSQTTKIRMLSMPVKHPLAGAWMESWLVYVKFTDLDRDLGQSFISDTYASTGWTADSDKARFFTKSGQIDWIAKAVERVHDAYFIHEGETARTIDGVPQVKLNNVSWYQNMMFKPADDAVPTNDASDQYQHLQAWQMLQQMQMTELTYEKYLETYGVKAVNPSQGNPEILRFARSWTQPVNAIEPTTGAPSSAWSWSDEIKMDKPKRFEEPGFLVLLTTVRPKLFQANLDASMVGNLWGFSDWYPSYNSQDPTAGIKSILGNDPVFALGGAGTSSEELIYDHRDLLYHGEQFINTDTHPYTLPTSSGLSVASGTDPEDHRGEYCSSSDIDALFVGETNRVLYYEGMGSCVISGHITDSTR